MRIVFDTNVWISAYAFNGRLRRLLDRVIEDQLKVAVSQDILDEMARVLGGAKFRMSAENVETIMREIRDVSVLVHPTVKLKVVERDPDDDRILECAVAADAEVIVTGDDHLLALGVFRGIRILSPGALLDGPPKRSVPGGEGVKESRALYRVSKTPKKRTNAPKRRRKNSATG